MKTLNIPLEDRQYRYLMRAKKRFNFNRPKGTKKNWGEFLTIVVEEFQEA